MSSSSRPHPTYYEVLELTSSASSSSSFDPTTVTLLDIKKAYRRLALQHHPDRNNSPESVERFQRIGQAYEILSNPTTKSAYDRSLRQQQQQSTPTAGSTSTYHHHHGQYNTTPSPPSTAYYSSPPPPYAYTNPYDRFDDLFRHDPFFQQAFDDLDDEFARRFNNNNNNNKRTTSHGATTNPNQLPRRHNQGWACWILECLGVDVTMTSTTTVGGSTRVSSYASSAATRTYTNRAVVHSTNSRGQAVQTRSMEQNGNQIQETWIDQVLMERRVNGVVVFNNSGDDRLEQETRRKWIPTP